MASVKSIVDRHGGGRDRLLDILRDVQAQDGRVSEAAVGEIARLLGLSRVDVEGPVTFYHFFSGTPAGRYAVYLNDNIVSVMNGRAAVARAFEAQAGCQFGQVSPDGLIGLHETSCQGMNDQEPSALINGVVFTRLTEARVAEIVAGMRAGRTAQDMVEELGDGANQGALVRSMVRNNIRRPGPVLFAPFQTGTALARSLTLSPEAVIEEIKKANLLGRGGAGFPTGLKWEFCRKEKADRRYVVCNADEGEPGTFKDRVILTELPHLLFEGMAVAGYAIGAELGILYLRSEYAYLRAHLESVLDRLRSLSLLGPSAGGRAGFRFDIQIRMGAGAYICGEESALLESAEGKRGEPRDRPPFPVSCGYECRPTTVNNVETLCAAARIMVQGADWFRALGTPRSAGTKLLSVSGDCERPGIYEVEFGLTVAGLLEMAGASNTQAVQVGGPSGTCVDPSGFERKLAFEDLPTGGSIIVFDCQRDLLEIVANFMDFFVEESCGWCTPCRAGNVILRDSLTRIRAGQGTSRDLKDIEAWGKIIKATSRCGLGQTSPNPLLTTLRNFPHLYQKRLETKDEGRPAFDLRAAMEESCRAAGRTVPCLEEERS
jgi:[NiFe] hydrogenase diaphorase moiety large subunit